MSPEKLALVEKLVAESEILQIGGLVYNIVSVKDGIVTVLENREDTSVVYQEHIPVSFLVSSKEAALFRLAHFLDLHELA